MFSPEQIVLAADGGSPLGSNLLLLIIFAAMFLLLFVLPARRQKKDIAELQQRQNRMAPGMRVKTGWGLYGTVISTNPETGIMQLLIAENTVIEVDRRFVTDLVDDLPRKTEEDKKDRV